jgi:hypothetical protein
MLPVHPKNLSYYAQPDYGAKQRDFKSEKDIHYKKNAKTRQSERYP